MNHRTQPPEPQRQAVAALYVEHADRVRRIVAAGLRPADLDQADDLAQDVWLTLWQYVLRGNVIDRPAGLLSAMARHRVTDHYRSARVRREIAVDPTTPAGLGGLDRAVRRELVAA
ncbi:MAG: sigma-70 family RNA polymerase sigma factor [Streptomycetaceae bacterium]|nr:sigma-70 family RNA polymerase sigma factor [Streptomycetaceae bacterium]